jgi:hypothetical protein
VIKGITSLKGYRIVKVKGYLVNLGRKFVGIKEVCSRRARGFRSRFAISFRGFSLSKGGNL